MYRSGSQASLQRNHERHGQRHTSLRETSVSSRKSTQSLKSILSNKSVKSEAMRPSETNFSDSISGSSESITRRRARFDKQNIDLTYKPMSKDYGHIKITQANTPFPRKQQSIPPNYRKPYCMRPSTSKLFKEEARTSIPVTLPRAFGSKLFDKPVELDFLAKRKMFNQGEYTLTRQRRPFQVHPPLKSIVLNPTPPTSRIALTEFFRRHYRQRKPGPMSALELI